MFASRSPPFITVFVLLERATLSGKDGACAYALLAVEWISFIVGITNAGMVGVVMGVISVVGWWKNGCGVRVDLARGLKREAVEE
jgi:hypothetical protein